MRAYPKIILDLDFSDRVVDVIEEGFDAVVRFAEVGDSRLMTRVLGTNRRRLVAAQAYLAAKGVPRIPDDLKTELPKTAVASTLEPLIFMAEQGMGIAYLPDFAISRQLGEGLLVTVLDDYTDRSGPPSDPMAVEPASRSQAQSIRRLSRRES